MLLSRSDDICPVGIACIEFDFLGTPSTKIGANPHRTISTLVPYTLPTEDVVDAVVSLRDPLCNGCAVCIDATQLFGFFERRRCVLTLCGLSATVPLHGRVCSCATMLHKSNAYSCKVPIPMLLIFAGDQSAVTLLARQAFLAVCVGVAVAVARRARRG